jgi:Xaa-Pro aminopeptidase
VTSRLAGVRGLLDALALDAVVVSAAVDVRYLSGFRGEDAVLVVSRDEALICSDSRFWAQIREESPGFELVKTEELLDDALRVVGERCGPTAWLGFQGGHLSYAAHRRVRRRFAGRLRNVGDRVSDLRQVKEAGEVECLRRAAAVTDGALAAAIAGGLEGRTEAEVAWAIECAVREGGGEGSAFAPIVATAERGALAHAIPGERRLARGDLVVIDCGARVEGYCSDITRTVAIGSAGEEERTVYGVVLAAQSAGRAAVRAGVGGRAVDEAARAVIRAAGHGDAFGHGTGHGVGLEVHEKPRLGKRRGDPLAAGMVCTVEPGIYLEGRFGVRIEDTVLVTATGCETLTHLPRELRTVA